MRFEGLQACTKCFQGGTPPLLLAYLLFNQEYSRKNGQEYYMIPKSGTIHWIASGWGPGIWAQQEQHSLARIVSGAGSLKSPGNQGRGIGEGWDIFFSKAASKGLPSPFNAAGGWRCSNLITQNMHVHKKNLGIHVPKNPVAVNGHLSFWRLASCVAQIISIQFMVLTMLPDSELWAKIFHARCEVVLGMETLNYMAFTSKYTDLGVSSVSNPLRLYEYVHLGITAQEEHHR